MIIDFPKFLCLFVIPLIYSNVLTAISEEVRTKKVLRICAQTDEKVEQLLWLVNKFQVDLWTQPRAANSCVLAAVDESHNGNSFLEAMNASMITYGIKSTSLQQYLDEISMESDISFNSSHARLSATHAIFRNYLRYPSIFALLRDWHQKNGNRFVLTSIGKSVEGRSILATTFNSIGPKRDGTQDRALVVECGIHAREWISPAICLYIIYELLYSKESSQILEQYRVHIIPILNPDGYVYTWEKNRLWRKNRSGGQRCRGVDLNRNFDVDFCRIGSSRDPCDETFCGRRAFSEPETRAFRNFMLAAHNNVPIHVYFSIHSYGQTFTYPYGFTKKQLPDFQQRYKISREANKKMHSLYGESYSFGQTAKVVYASSGGSDDWTQVTLKPKAVYVLESRDKGRFGFLLPPSMIIPAAREAMAAIKSILNSLNNRPETPESPPLPDMNEPAIEP